jgi:N-acetylglucosamine-6-phosphate deacetylase
MPIMITGGLIITPHSMLPEHTLIIEGGKIAEITAQSPEPTEETTVLDAAGYYVVPGFLDVHVHGGDGADTMDATPEALHTMARFFARHGVTSYYPTTMTDSAENIQRALENVAACPQPTDGAQHLGAHIEGPYLNVEYKGAQPDEFFRNPDPAEYARWLQTGAARLITVAPELEGAAAMIEELAGQGVEFAAGHSAASYDQMLLAASSGLRQATHTFNGMRGLHHREPGTLGAALSDDRIYAQVIADGVHVHPAMVKMLVRAKGTEKTILITDSMRAAGLADGAYTLGAQAITVSDGIARTQSGALAGSTVTLDQALRNVIAYAGLSLQEALPMATSVPAEVMNLAGQKGTLAPGADADVVLLDETLRVRLTLVGGRVVYRA